MKLFRVGKGGPDSYGFDGAYALDLPAVECPKCRLYSASSTGLPTLPIEQLPNPDDYKSGPPVLQERYEELAAPIAKLLNREWPLLPGMGLGPFHGYAYKREKRDFLWIHGRTMVLRESAHEALLKEGVDLLTGPAIVTNTKGDEVRAEYRRVAQILPVPCMASETLKYAEHRVCSECGIKVRSWPERLFLDASKIPPALDLFAVGKTTKLSAFENIIVSERLVKAVEKRRLTNIVFESVEVV